jgi:hypothetical protein
MLLTKLPLKLLFIPVPGLDLSLRYLSQRLLSFVHLYSTNSSHGSMGARHRTASSHHRDPSPASSPLAGFATAPLGSFFQSRYKMVAIIVLAHLAAASA